MLVGTITGSVFLAAITTGLVAACCVLGAIKCAMIILLLVILLTILIGI